jgi:threonine aldolase
MRQVGILGAAGLVALQEFINDGNNNMIGQDHDRTKQIADFLLSNPNPIFKVREPVETNIIFIEINEEFDSAIIAKQLSDQGVLVSAWSKRLIRLVLHRDITDIDVTKVCQAFSAFLL